MKQWIFNFVVFTLFFAHPLQAFQKKYEIQFSFKEDGRKWNKSNTVDDAIFELNEYYLEGQSVDGWAELVTTQFFVSKIDFTLDEFFKNFLRELSKNHLKNKIDSRIICMGDNEMTAEWWISERGPNNQHERVRIFRQNNHVGILRYTTKIKNEQASKAFEKILNQACFRPLKP